MIGGRRAFLQPVSGLRLLTCLAGAGCLAVCGCTPTEQTPSSQEAAPAVEAVQAETPQPADSPASAPPASFAERFEAFPVTMTVESTFSAALAYAPPAFLGSPRPAENRVPFPLRGSFAERTGPSSDPNAPREPWEAPPPLPRPARARADSPPRPLKGDTATRIASLAPFVPLPTNITPVTPRAPKASDIEALVTAKAEEHGVPADLAHAVVRVESNYNPTLTGKGATLGLMQIKYATARSLGFTGTPKDLFDPATNLEWGMRYLAGARRLAKGDVCGTILRYQAGHRAVRMTPAANVYCSKVRRLLAATKARQTAEASAGREAARP